MEVPYGIKLYFTLLYFVISYVLCCSILYISVYCTILSGGCTHYMFVCIVIYEPLDIFKGNSYSNSTI